MEVDLSATAQEIADELGREAPERSVEWLIEPGLRVWADVPLLRIAMQNLLQNAWKFTGRQARPTIRVGVGEHMGTRQYFVADNGAGFNMAYADKLFGAFQRLHPDTEFPGSGIGLAIVRRIILRHGGNISAVATPGEGATFWFSLKEMDNGNDGRVA
jgi:light-regulated signal transduction histidine kinase (bacteriophytochrome)